MHAGLSSYQSPPLFYACVREILEYVVSHNELNVGFPVGTWQIVIVLLIEERWSFLLYYDMRLHVYRLSSL